jgi:uncharacterized protein (DUF2345 family)
MKTKLLPPVLVLSLLAGVAIAQDRTQSTQPQQTQQTQQKPAGGHEPPPQAYEDCKGKKTGDTVQHTTPEGKVAATCVESPKGLVARPSQPQGSKQGDSKR